MKSFKNFITEVEAPQPQRERRRITKELSPTASTSVPEPPPNPAGRRRTRSSAVARDLEAASAPAAPTLTTAQRAAIEKGYRTPTGQQTIRGLETYATRRGAMGYGDAGKNPAQYGVDPRAVSAQSRERTAAAAAGDPVARSGIKSDYKKIDKKYPNPNPTTGFADFSRRATAAADIVQPDKSQLRNVADTLRTQTDDEILRKASSNILGGGRKSDSSDERIGAPTATSGTGERFRRQRVQQPVTDLETKLSTKLNSPRNQPVPTFEPPATRPVGTGEVTRDAARNDAFRDMENDLLRPTKGTVGVTRKGAPITTSTTRTSTNPAPAPAPQRAVTTAIDQQRQSAADTTPAAIKKQNAAVMGSAARTLSKVTGGYLGYQVGERRGEGTAGKLTRAFGAGLATDALANAVYNRLPRPLKTVGAVVTAAAAQKGVNSLITTLRQQLGMK